MTGSSPLTPDQQDWYAEHFGVRYTTVQENHLRPSRAMRRARPRDQRDIDTRNAQVAMIQALRANPLQSTPTGA